MASLTRSGFILLCVSFLLASCTEDANLDYFESLSVEPLVESSLFYLRSTEQVINEFGDVSDVYEELFEFEAFSQEFVDDRIEEGTIFYEISNTTSKPLLLDVLFLDQAGNLLYAEQFDIRPFPLDVQLERQVFYGPGGVPLSVLSNTAQLLVRVRNLGDTVSESLAPDPSLIFRSSFQVRLRLL